MCAAMILNSFKIGITAISYDAQYINALVPIEQIRNKIIAAPRFNLY